MSKETDTEIVTKIYVELVTQNISIDTCKECIHLDINNISCKREIPNPLDCNLLKILREN